MNNIWFKGSTLKIGETSVLLPSPIDVVVEVDDIVLVLLHEKGSRKRKPHGNIYAFDRAGHRLWIVDAPPMFEGWYHPFTGLYVRDGLPFAYSPIGVEYEINISDGRLIEIPGQRPW